MTAGECVATVITPVFNSARTLRRAAASALDQTLRDIELLIVDDGSTDGTKAVIQDIAASDPRVRTITLPDNGGKSRAMNYAMAAARGRWLAVLDADDQYRPERLALTIEAAESAGVQLVADNQYLFDAGADCMVGAAMPVSSSVVPLTVRSFAAGCDPYASFDLGMLKPVVRADFVRRAAIAYRESAKLAEDFLFLAEFLAAGGEAILLRQPLYVWTQAFGSLSRRWTETGGGAWRYDFASAVTAHREVRQEFAAHGHAELVQLLDRRAHAFRRLTWLTEASRLRASGASAIAVGATLVRHPSVWPFLARRALGLARAESAWQRFDFFRANLLAYEVPEPHG